MAKQPEPATQLSDLDLRTCALSMAIRAGKKIAYGPPGIEHTLKMTEAFYKFLKGSPCQSSSST